MSARVLIVEDEKAIQLALRGLLRRDGYDVDLADTGEDALRKLSEQPYDLVITDLALGRGISGMDVLRASKEAREKQQEAAKDLVERVQKALETRVHEVRVTGRLTESPACLVVGDHDMGVQMRCIMQAAGQQVPEAKPIMELNPDHPLVKRLDAEPDEDRFATLATILFEQAQLASGDELEDPAAYVRRLNGLLLELSGG